MSDPEVISGALGESLNFIRPHADARFQVPEQEWERYETNGKECYWRRLSSGMVAVCDEIGGKESELTMIEFQEAMSG